MTVDEAGFVRALCFYDACGMAPTRTELWTSFDTGSSVSFVADRAHLQQVFNELLNGSLVREQRGRIVFAGRETLIAEHERRLRFMPRKWRRARSAAQWLRRLEGVRAICVCNTTSVDHAGDDSDVDFFVVTRVGALWQTRACATLPFKLTGQRPGDEGNVIDPICLSFFMDDTRLDLTRVALSDDPYLRHWFLSLNPLFDDGVLAVLWEQNTNLRQRHPLAYPWTVSAMRLMTRPRFRLPMAQQLEAFAQQLQEPRLPKTIREVANRDTCVMVDEHILKLHVQDGRTRVREAYRAACERYGVES